MEYKDSYASGIKAAMPVALGYIPIAVAFGVFAVSLGIPGYGVILMSIIVFAGASQFIGVSLLAAGATGWEIILTTFFINIRHMMMTMVLSQRIDKKAGKLQLALAAFGVTDESFGVSTAGNNATLGLKYMYGLNFTGYLSWVAGTVLGVFVADIVPQSIQACMGIALYAMFIGLIMPSLKLKPDGRIAAAISAGVSGFFYWVPVLSHIPAGWRIIVAATAGAAATMIIRRKE